MSGGLPRIDGFDELRVLARGGFSTVYEARQPSAGRRVAIKVLDEAIVDEATRLRFERECQTLGAVSAHPGICTLYSSGQTDDGRPYLILELCAGTLAGRLRDSGPMAVEEAVATLIHLGEALGQAHRKGIVHRDVKPQNVLVTQFGQLVVTDFGIARTEGGFQTTTGLVTASLAHAAPEVLDGGTASVASDVWSLASTGYQLLTGSSPFRRQDEPSSTMIARILRDPPPDLRPLGVPDAVAQVLEAAMAKDPAIRTPDMPTFVAALRSVGDSVRPRPVLAAEPPAEPTVAVARRVPGPAEPATGSRRRRKLVPVAGALAVVGVLLVGAAVALSSGDDDGLRAVATSPTTSTTLDPAASSNASVQQGVARPESFCVQGTNGDLKIRATPGSVDKSSDDVLAAVPEGDCAVFDAALEPELEQAGAGEWRRVEWHGVVGWSFDRYLRPNPGGT